MFQDPCHARHCAEYFVCILYPPPPPHHSSGTQKLIVPISQSQKPRLRESKRFDHDRNLSPHHKPTPTQRLVTTSPRRGQLWLSQPGPSLISARLDLLLHLLSSGLAQPFSGRSPRPGLQSTLVSGRGYRCPREGTCRGQGLLRPWLGNHAPSLCVG